MTQEIMSQEKVNDLYTMLGVLLKVLDSKHIKYWIVCGTLLGAVRHGGIIPWDTDADVQIGAEDMLQRKAEIDRALRTHDLRLDFKQVKDAGAICRVVFENEDFDSVVTKKMPYIDVYSYDYKTGLPSGIQSESDLLAICMAPKKSDLVRLREMKLGPLTVKTLSNPEEYLFRSYGPSWKYVKSNYQNNESVLENFDAALPTSTKLSFTKKKENEKIREEKALKAREEKARKLAAETKTGKEKLTDGSVPTTLIIAFALIVLVLLIFLLRKS